MKEHPIIFSGPMVRAILDGRKTQTRRIVKPQPIRTATGWQWRTYTWGLDKRRPVDVIDFGSLKPCPYGQPGDRLWVRETWQEFCPLWGGNWCGHGDAAGMMRDHEIYYAADDSAAWKRGKPARWRPSIHMPRWASRLALEVTGVRVERLQEISDGDCYSEGAAEWAAANAERRLGIGMKYISIREAFKALWDSINAERAPWASNPWGWVVEFKKITPQSRNGDAST